MKSLALFPLLLLCFNCYSQLEPGRRPVTDSMSVSFAVNSTTVEEFNYMTKGYQIAIQSGLDVKSGYELGDSRVYPGQSATVTFISLNKKAPSKHLVGTILKVETSSTETYFAIPVNNIQLLNQTQKALYTAYYAGVLTDIFCSYVTYAQEGFPVK